jgi:hypothetical protein
MEAGFSRLVAPRLLLGSSTESDKTSGLKGEGETGDEWRVSRGEGSKSEVSGLRFGGSG